jgi:RIO kinase 1
MARNYRVDDFDDFDELDRHPPPRPRRSRPTWDVTDPDPELPDGATRSTYQESRAAQGPQPPPSWLVTTSAAIDVDRGVVRTGKEADIHLVERTDPGTGASCLLADKRYRSQQHRMFHRDAAYLEGRRVRRSRENRAMANRTAFGRQVIAGQWASAEFETLGMLWSAGVAVPYPVQLGGTRILIEFIGDRDGTAAPQLAELRPDGDELDDLWRQCRETLASLAAIGFTHGDLSAYNVIVHDGRFLLIDLPQVVDVVVNPMGPAFLRRDCENICGWFMARGLRTADPERLVDDLAAIAGTRLRY